MRKQYDFGKAKRGPVVRVPKGKARITIRLDEDVLEWFRGQVHQAGGGSYQNLINSALQEYIQEWQSPDFHRLEAQPFLWMFLLTLAAFAAAMRAAVATP